MFIIPFRSRRVGKLSGVFRNAQLVLYSFFLLGAHNLRNEAVVLFLHSIDVYLHNY
jgi:hypothetical protein